MRRSMSPSGWKARFVCLKVRLSGSALKKVTASSPRRTAKTCSHFSEIQGDGYKSLDENAKVEFVIASGSNGKSQATQVCVL